MADSDSTTAVVPLQTALNVTALAKRFGVARTTIQRRLKRGWVPPAAPPRKPHAALPAPAAQGAASGAAWRSANAAPRPRQAASVIRGATLTAALALAACSAGFSICGLTAIFAGAFWPVVGMGAALELGKLSAVAWLGERRHGRALRCALIALVGVLMALNSIGVYGFLSRAHIAHAVAGELKVDGDAAAIDSRLSVQSSVVADLDRRIDALDSMVNAATGRGYVKTAMALVAAQAQSRADLVAQRTIAAATLAGLKAQRAAVEGERRQVGADMGPVRYLATLLGSTDEATLRCFILAVALLLDPAAVLLLLAFVSRRRPAGSAYEHMVAPLSMR